MAHVTSADDDFLNACIHKLIEQIVKKWFAVRPNTAIAETSAINTKLSRITIRVYIDFSRIVVIVLSSYICIASRRFSVHLPSHLAPYDVVLVPQLEDYY